MSTHKHTPTPWQYHKDPGGPQFIVTDGKTAHAGGIASVWGEGNAAFIVRACNSHDALLAALQRIVNDCPKPGEDAVLTVEGYNQASAAILKATTAPELEVGA